MERKILEKELSYQITGISFKVHKELGRFCRERQYADRFEETLKKDKVPYKREFELKELKQNAVSGNRVDFIIDNRLLLDLKAKNLVTKEDYFQMQRYLKAANLKLGLIINFRSPHLKPKRVINFEV